MSFEQNVKELPLEHDQENNSSSVHERNSTYSSSSSHANTTIEKKNFSPNDNNNNNNSNEDQVSDSPLVSFGKTTKRKRSRRRRTVRRTNSKSTAKGENLDDEALDQMTEEFEKELDSVSLKETHKQVHLEKSKKNTVELPNVPKWNKSRSFLTWNFIDDDNDRSSTDKSSSKSLDLLNISIQEMTIMEELLNALLGFDGKYIRSYHKNTEQTREIMFVLEETMDPSLANLIKRILPLCGQHVYVQQFINVHSQYEYGMVSQAFCAAVRGLLKEFSILVAQLESQLVEEKLSLQRMWYYLQPSIRTMDVLKELSTAISTKQSFGGALLNLLYDKSITIGGDEQTKNLFEYLMERACEPYFEMVEKWIYEGKVDDPYQEFMIIEDKNMTKENIVNDFNDSYWEKRYTIRTEHFPKFFNRVSEKILTTGKYLNVVRECGQTFESPIAEKMKYTPHDREYVEKIDRAFLFSSRRLLELLMKEEHLMERLKSIKHYFLLDQGDFFVHFMDIAEDELRKRVKYISTNKVQSLLELSLRTSIVESDPFKDDLQCRFERLDLCNYLIQINKVASSKSTRAFQEITQGTERRAPSLTGLEAFVLDYTVRWPFSLVVNRKALVKFQMIFRHLFHCKNVERRLSSIWLKHQFTKELYNIGSTFTMVYSLRQRMIHFLQNFEYYMMIEVIEPNWHTMEQNIRQSSTVDEVMRYLSEFLDTCLKACMLSNTSLFKTLSKLLSTCVIFCDHVERFTNTLILEKEDIYSRQVFGTQNMDDIDKAYTAFEARQVRSNVLSEHIRSMGNDNNFITTLQRSEQYFNKYLKRLIENLKAQTHASASDAYLTHLVARLDFNGFYDSLFQ